jgi:hypothetical protein
VSGFVVDQVARTETHDEKQRAVGSAELSERFVVDLDSSTDVCNGHSVPSWLVWMCGCVGVLMCGCVDVLMC